MKKIIILCALTFVANAQVPSPQINLTGNIGCEGFPCLNSGTINFPSDADHTMTVQESSATGGIKLVSGVALTTTRKLILPTSFGKLQFIAIENATTGGQAIQVIGQSGTGVTIANGSTATVWFNGTDVVQSGNASTALIDNVLLNSPTTGKLFIETDSIGLIINGAFPEDLATMLGVPTANRNINSIGSASMPDMLSCVTVDGCTAGVTYPYQIGAYPVAFPLGVAANSKTVLEMGFNDLSNMGPTPTQNQLDYYHGGVLAWGLMYGIPDAEKLTPASCVTTGTWTAVSAVPGGSGTFPAGTIETVTPGATITCTGYNATDAGFVGYKSTTSTSATYTISVTNSGTTYNVTDSYTNSATLNQTAYYTTAWGGTANLYAIGQSGMGGGYTSMTLTTASNSADPVIVVMPYFISPSSSRQNAPAVEYALTSREGCNGDGTCGTISGHPDSATNQLRSAQMSAANELRSNGLNVSYFDPNATPTGFNSSDPSQVVKVYQYTVSAGGSGYTSVPTMTVTGCTINPTGAVTLSGGAVVTGTFDFATTGACYGGSPVVSFSGGGGSGATATASATTTDGTHPNDIGGQNFANAAFVNLNSATMAQDHFLPGGGSGGSISGCTSSSGTLTCAGFVSNGSPDAYFGIAPTGTNPSGGFSWTVPGANNFQFAFWGTGNGAGLPGAGGLYDSTTSKFVFSTNATDDLYGYTPITNVAAGTGATWSILHTGAADFVSVTSPSFLATTTGTGSSTAIGFTAPSLNAFALQFWGSGNGAGLSGAGGLWDATTSHFAWSTNATDDIYGYTPVTNVAAGTGATWQIQHTGDAGFRTVTGTVSGTGNVAFVGLNNSNADAAADFTNQATASGIVNGMPVMAALAPNLASGQLASIYVGLNGTSGSNADLFTFGWMNKAGTGSALNYGWMGMGYASTVSGVGVCQDGTINSGITWTSECNENGGGIYLTGHLQFIQPTLPTVSSCGGGTPTLSGTDQGFHITGLSSATACTVTFHSNISGFCTASGYGASSTPELVGANSNSASVTFSFPSGTTDINAVCF